MKDNELNIDKEEWFFVLDIPDPVESFQSRQSQLDPIDYRLLIWKP